MLSTSALYSNFWVELDTLIKRTVIDEAQKVNKRVGTCHQALMTFDIEAYIVLSGILTHNVLHNFSRICKFCQEPPR